MVQERDQQQRILGREGVEVGKVSPQSRRVRQLLAPTGAKIERQVLDEPGRTSHLLQRVRRQPRAGSPSAVLEGQPLQVVENHEERGQRPAPALPVRQGARQPQVDRGVRGGVDLGRPLPHALRERGPVAAARGPRRHPPVPFPVGNLAHARHDTTFGRAAKAEAFLLSRNNDLRARCIPPSLPPPPSPRPPGARETLCPRHLKAAAIRCAVSITCGMTADALSWMVCWMCCTACSSLRSRRNRSSSFSMLFS